MVDLPLLYLNRLTYGHITHNRRQASRIEERLINSVCLRESGVHGR